MSALNVTVEDNPTFIINSINNDFTGNMSINITNVVKYDDVVKTLIEIGKLTAGNYSANVTFYGDNNYNNKTLTVNFTVSRVVPAINVEIQDVTYPNKAIAIISMANNANGTVKITIGTQVFEGTVTDGTASVDLTGLDAGSKDAVIEFTTTDNYNDNATANARFTVHKASSDIEIVVENVYKVGENIEITLNKINSTGEVTVTINGVPQTVENNKVTIPDGLAEGTYTIIANLAEDTNYDSATNTKVFNVVKNTINLTVDVGSDAHVGDEKQSQ